MQLRTTIIFIFLLNALFVFAQPINNECLNAIQITNLTEWCSAQEEFTSIGSTASGTEPFCFPNGIDQNDVWFYFTAIANTLNVGVIGNIGLSPGGSINAPQLALYSGDCLNGLVEEECFSDAFGNNFAETFISGLTPGQNYYIQVSARNENRGTFQLCLSNFNSPPEPDGDCVTGVILCDKTSFSVDYVLGGGSDNTEVDDGSCLIGCGGVGSETSSAWYKWTCDQPGSLTFSITPNNPDDDIDFLVYELPNGVDNCNGKIELRCMASGENVGQPIADWIRCTGATGALAADTDQGEGCGCEAGDNNFVAPINMEAGKSYALIINNFSNSSSGFGLSWGGSGTFLGPEVDFSLTPNINIECDQAITVTDASSFAGGNIVGWTWSFGPGGIPSNDFTPNPPPITFESFGDKIISLTVESDGGCFVTKTIPITVLECCVFPSDLRLDLIDSMDPICAGSATGSIELQGSNGDPQYLFSLNGANPLPFPVFTNLTAGTYEVFIQDIKGCENTITVDLFDPPPVTVDAGPDITIELGETVNFNAIATPSGTITAYDWDNEMTLSCEDCPNPEAFPFGSTEYTVTAENALGCSGEDRVLVVVRDNRPIYIPNVISPNDDGLNDRFHIFGNAAAVEISLLRIFNRWGALVYEETNLPLGENVRGWNGTFRGQKVNPDVFAFYANIRFIDGREILYEGDITVMR